MNDKNGDLLVDFRNIFEQIKEHRLLALEYTRG